jgi:hypothetical protein
MARAYSVSVVAHAIDANAKWLDNLLTHNSLSGVERARQGVARSLTPDAILVIFIARQIMGRLGAPAKNALDAALLLARDGHAGIATGIQMTIEIDAIREGLTRRLVDAVQSAPRKTRGRPRRRRRPDQGSAGQAKPLSIHDS